MPIPKAPSLVLPGLYLLGLLAFTVSLQLYCGRMHDPDSFYHYHHAQIYRQQGLLLGSFPWLTASVMARRPGDLWYGFHVLIAPLTLAANPVTGMLVAASVVMTLGAAMILAAVKLQRFAWPYLWPILYLFSAQGVVFRSMCLRPQLLSDSLCGLLLVALLSKRYRLAAVCAALVAFVHLNLAWLVIVTASVVWLVRGYYERNWRATWLIGVLAAIACGWILRPHPINTAYLLYVQLVVLFHTKAQGVMLDFGKELRPMALRDMAASLGLFAAIWLISLCASAFWIYKKACSNDEKVLLATAGALSVLFFAMTVLVALRSIDPWNTFAVILVAAVVTRVLGVLRATEQPSWRSRTLRSAIGAGAACAVGLSLARGIPQVLASPPPNRLQHAAEWLRERGRPGAIVFSPDWSLFPELFFWDDRNRYINGMDPIFEYTYSPARYWETVRLNLPQFTATTSPTAPRSGGNFVEVDTYQALRRDFNASYIIVTHTDRPELFKYLLRDPRYILRFYERGRAAVFELKGSP